MIIKLLIVDNDSSDQRSVDGLFKRSMCVNGWSLTVFFASCHTDARDLLEKHQFDIITLDGLMGLEMGYHLIPSIQQLQKSATIIMISGDNDSLTKGMLARAHFGFSKKDITEQVMLNTDFQLVPIAKWKAFHFYTSVGMPTDFFWQ